MKTNFKYYTLVVLLALVVIASSCMKNESDDVQQNTPATEAALIKAFIDAQVAGGNDSIEQTASGLYILNFEDGEGLRVQEGDPVGLIYTGFFVDMQVFDSSIGREDEDIYKFTQTDQMHVDGFYEAVSKLNKGAKGIFLLPSDMAYGPYGKNPIGPYTPILFSLELKEIY